MPSAGSLTYIDENGNERERFFNTSKFAVKFVNSDDNSVYEPAWATEVVRKNAKNIDQTTTQCGDTKAKAYGSKDNAVYEVSCVIADAEFTLGLQRDDPSTPEDEVERRNLDIDTIIDKLETASEVQIFTGIRSPVIQPTDVKITQNNTVNEIEVADISGQGTGPFPAFQAEFKFGKEEEE
jgi:hypothetical protein